MKFLVCGGRNFGGGFGDRKLIEETIRLLRPQEDLVIHGGAPGADSTAAEVARLHGLHTAEVRALWEFYGRRAGPLRNTVMLGLAPDKVIAFPGGAGTMDCVRRAGHLGIPVEKVGWK